jgi:hypothetical protein
MPNDPNVTGQLLLPGTDTKILARLTIRTMSIVGQALTVILQIINGTPPQSLTFRVQGKLSAAGLNDLPIDEEFKYFD